MARRKPLAKANAGPQNEERELTIWEQEYVERKPRFERAPLPDHIPADSVLRQEYSLEFLMKHPKIADAVLREYEKYYGPLPPVRIRYTKRPYGKKKTTKSDKTKTRRKGVSE
jgi:hypothetical protein